MRRGKNEKKQELTGSDFEYVLVLGEELSPQNCRGYVENLRKEGDKLGLRFVPTGDDWRVIMVAATVEALGRQAEQISLLKPLIRGLQPTGPFVYEIRQDFVGWGSQGFFLPCERSHLTYMLLLNMKGIDISGVPYVLITRLEHDGVIEAVFPAHDHVETKKLLQKSFFRRGESERDGLGFLGDLASVVFSPVNGIREYYGSEVAFYFAWLDFFTLWLLAPSLVGFSLWYFRGEYTVDDSPYIPFFSLFVIFWSALYIKYWDRQASDFACRWGTLDAARKESIRPQFEGEIRTSPITGKPEIYFSAYHRIPLYTFSFAVTLVALGIAGIVMGLFLNLEGYVHKDSPIYVPWLAKRAEPGGFFFVSDNDGLWQNIVGMVPVVLHSSVILGLNSLYRYIAEWLTEVENHRTEHEHEDSLIIKRFLFEAFDCYMALFYIAFYELNPIHLRKELISLYCVDSLRRVACECALPLVLQKATALVDSLIQKPPLSNKKRRQRPTSRRPPGTIDGTRVRCASVEWTRG
uniref:Anoctamin transmembrane domain-containing protein n=1 Tax=Amorphochlora amoebiformis TaxID=1561963 RepID=A0A7S0DS14_9EUKA|mmetsp:Transcript_5744/g.8820  ORF Transcript_5744/g.8820 Transcript_5744/m.8820 type:complete len:521 (+) Transcript_5744:82-1644(+)